MANKQPNKGDTNKNTNGVKRRPSKVNNQADPLAKFRELHLLRLDELNARFGIGSAVHARFEKSIKEATTIAELADAEDALNAFEAVRSNGTPADESMASLPLFAADGSPLATREAQIARQVEILAEHRAKKAGPSTEENPNPDIKPKSAVEQMFESFTKSLGDFKMPDLPDMEGGVLPEGMTKTLGRSLWQTTDSHKRHKVFMKMCDDEDLAKEERLLERFEFLARYAPSIALDYDLAKSFIKSPQHSDIGSAIGLIRAQQTVQTAARNKVLRNALIVGGVAAAGYAFGMTLNTMLKKKGA